MGKFWTYFGKFLMLLGIWSQWLADLGVKCLYRKRPGKCSNTFSKFHRGGWTGFYSTQNCKSVHKFSLSIIILNLGINCIMMIRHLIYRVFKENYDETMHFTWKVPEKGLKLRNCVMQSRESLRWIVYSYVH